MDLEEIEEMRADIKKLNEPRELNIPEALKSVLNIKKKYNAFLEINGKDYCTKNCSDIPRNINKLLAEFTEYDS